MGGYYEGQSDTNFFNNGKLVKAMSEDEGLKNNVYRRGYDIPAPDGDDTDFINKLLEVYNRYGDDRTYFPLGMRLGTYTGNSNNLAWSLLVGACVNPSSLKDLADPFGPDWAPGWGTALPEMIR